MFVLMATIREMRDLDERITFFCRADVAACTHSWTPSWDQLIQYFGQDADFTKDRSVFEQMVCEQCGGRGATIIVHPQPSTHGLNTGQGGHDHGTPAVTVEEATRRYHDFRAEQRRLGIQTIAEVNAASRAKLKARAKASKSGADFIGPPNPWALRKKGR